MIINANNERAKRIYAHYMREACGLAESTINQRLYAITLYEGATDGADFKAFRKERAIALRKKLLERSGKRKGDLSSRSTVDTTLKHLHKFFSWLAVQPGYMRALRAQDADYFNLSRREAKLASYRPEKFGPPIELIADTIRQMPSATAIEKRNRGLVALLLLTGMRVKALTSIKLKHVLPDGTGVNQDAREVMTKLGKSWTTYFFPVGEDILAIFLDYIAFLRSELAFSDNDPVFPSTRQDAGEERQLAVRGLTRSHWGTPDPVREIVKGAFASAGEAYCTPHTFRNSLVALGQKLCRTPREFKAWSQNLGHDDIMTSQRSYGAVPAAEQQQLVTIVGHRSEDGEMSPAELVAELQRRLAK